MTDTLTEPDASQATVGAPRRKRRNSPAFRLLRSPLAVLSGSFLLLVAAAAILAPLLAPFDPAQQDVGPALDAPSAGHWLGTDDLGRDVLSRLLFAARLSLLAAVSPVALALLVAIPLGLVAGFVGGWVDNVIMRLMDAGLSFPPLVLALSVTGVMGPGLDKVIVAIAVVFAPQLTRLIRGQAQAIRQETYIDVSRTVGTSMPWILTHRVLPNLRSPLMVSASFSMAAALLAEASLSYLGLGAQPPRASWGNMLRRAYDQALFTDAWALLVPGAAIALTVLSLTTMADCIRSAVGAEGHRTASIDRKGRRGATTVHRASRRTPTESIEPGGPLLAVRDLCAEFRAEQGSTQVLDHVTFDVAEREIVGIVGESGSGKTVTALSIMRLLPSPPGRITEGTVHLGSDEILGMGLGQLAKIRGSEISMVFQDPMTSLDPAFTVGFQLAEAVRLHERVSIRQARRRAVELLEMVGIPAPETRVGDYPHQLSGGMRQRVGIAIALACSPRLLIADEPTTALDVTIQAQVLELLRNLQEQMGFSAMLVTHDLGVVAETCQRVLVMYAGQIVEEGPVVEIFENPLHPYMEGLLKAIPQGNSQKSELAVIPGTVPALNALPTGCRFSSRCAYATQECRTEEIPLVTIAEGRRVRCRRWTELSLTGVEQ